MLILIWVTVLLAVRRNNAGNSVGSQSESCITPPELQAEVCLMLPCSSVKNIITDKGVKWYKYSLKQNCVAGETTAALIELENVSQRTCNITISNITTTKSGSYNIRVDGISNETAVYMLFNLTTITVKDLNQPIVTVPTLMEGQQATLSCTAPDLCSESLHNITWMLTDTEQNITHIEGNTTVEPGRSSNLTFMVSAELSGAKVTCKVNFTGNVTIEETVTLTVTSCPPVTTKPTEQQNDTTKPPSTTSNKIVTTSSKTSKTTQLGKLTFVCSGEGLSLPSIKWQLSLNHTECSLITFGLNETINCTVTLNKTDNSSATVECVCSKKNVTEDLKTMFLRLVKQPVIITAFLSGVLLTTIISTIICCLMSKCHRKKTRTYENLPGNLEMGVSQRDPLMDEVQEVEYDQINDQRAAEAVGAVAAGKPDVDYSTIKFSALKRQAKVEDSGETTETEYAEIKKEKTEEEQDGEGNEEAELIEETEETNDDVPLVEEGEDVAVNSDVKDIVDQI